MAYKLFLTAQAKADIEQAFGHLSERSPETAAQWYRLVMREIASLKNMPARCPLAPESETLGVELRQLLHGKKRGIYRIVFRVVEGKGRKKEVHILTIRHGARKPLSDEEMQPFLEIP
jgi:plasmid stabilization system protein ParE